ncbi:hypothetical protein NBRC116188_05620 [Oceaniserpentilla sp. 4NH20-0058]|uniref:Gfo/Idh/MocA family protein n=1 Tax=Oceaniserpentilla sp. 4NH20-0058 TaxID=3127660 RepID=UPI00310A8557
MIFLIGTGQMAIDYIHVLQDKELNFVVVGRGVKSAAAFQEKTSIEPVTGGIEKFIQETRFSQGDSAIIATGVEQLKTCCDQLMAAGVQKILVEKPAGLDLKEIESLAENASKAGCKIYVAYNRRFYASVLKAIELIEEDGGVESFNFEITEWGHVIEPLEKLSAVKQNWFLGNTSHVVDMAFYLGGAPKELSVFSKGGRDWHSRSYVFAGAGESEKGALFSYHGHWGAPGRWSVEVLTSKRRFIFRPLEKLQVQELGSVQVDFIEIDDEFDKAFKPGLKSQVEAFIAGDNANLCNIHEHVVNSKFYAEMAGYSSV